MTIIDNCLSGSNPSIDGTITSDLFRLRDLSAISKASVPFAKEIQFLALVNFAKFFQIFLLLLPTKFDPLTKVFILLIIFLFCGASLYRFVNLLSFFVKFFK